MHRLLSYAIAIDYTIIKSCAYLVDFIKAKLYWHGVHCCPLCIDMQCFKCKYSWLIQTNLFCDMSVKFLPDIKQTIVFSRNKVIKLSHKRSKKQMQQTKQRCIADSAPGTPCIKDSFSPLWRSRGVILLVRSRRCSDNDMASYGKMWRHSQTGNT